MKRWYAVHTHPKGESAALVNLERQGFEAYLPLYKKRRSHARKVDFVSTPLFPRYLFVAMDVEQARWRSIRSTMGVVHLVCHGDHPVAIPEGVVESIQARQGEDGMVALDLPPPFKTGERIRVAQGALRDVEGIFECLSDDQRVIVLLDLLGRKVRVRVPLEAVGACA
jgi:transcriptional antiterminator RfaH